MRIRTLACALFVLVWSVTLQAQTTIFQDAFTEVSSVALESHTPTDVGTGWSKVGTSQLDARSLDILRANATGSNTDALYTCSPASTTNNLDVTFKFIAGFPGTGTNPVFVVLRYTNSSNYLLVGTYPNDSASNLVIISVVAGSPTVQATTDFDLANNDIFKVELRGAPSSVTAEIFINSTTRLASGAMNLSALSGKGYGIAMGAASGTSTDDITTAWQLDDLVVVSQPDPAAGGVAPPVLLNGNGLNAGGLHPWHR